MMTTIAPTLLDRSVLLLRAGRHPLASEVERALEHRCGLGAAAKTVLGFSGGPDSTTLLVLMCALSEREFPVCTRPIALHVDHGLRTESGQEAEHARAFCKALGVSCQVVKLDLDPDESNLANRARTARYQALEDAARTHGVQVVCVAHHAEDRLESMIQALCRGSGASGLASPRWIRELGSAKLVRPLLGTSRDHLRSFCNELELPCTEDPSNASLDTARGLLRSQVLPVLEERWPGAAIRASAAADRLEIAAEALERELAASFGPASSLAWQRETFRVPAVELGAAALRRAITAHDSELGIDLKDRLPASLLLKVAAAAAGTEVKPRSFDLAGEWRIEIDVRDVRLVRGGSTPPRDRA